METLRPPRGLLFDPETHTYTFDNLRVPSVTDVLRPAVGWFSRNEAAADRGEAVHVACEDIDAGFEPELTPETAPYVRAYRDFLEAARVTMASTELRVFHASMRYAGTIDRVVQMPDGTLEVLDIKTGAPAPWMGIQLAAYSHALWVQANLDYVPRGVVLQLTKTGEYRMHEYPDVHGHYEGFVGLLRFWRWRQKFER